jgi:molecular chaperone DnaK (HSP70)
VHEVALTPRQLARSLSPLLDAYHDACERVLAQTGIAWRQLDAVILAGGSGALPGARERLLEISALPSERVRRTDPLTAASLGAALLARLDGSGAAASLLAPVARDIGILVFDPEQGRSAVHVILKRDEPLPARRSATVYTSRPNQQRITVEIVQSEGLDAEPAPLARFSLGPLPPRARNQPVELTLTCDARGQLTATARDPQTGRELAHQIDDPRQRAHARWRDLQAQIDSVRINE